MPFKVATNPRLPRQAGQRIPRSKYNIPNKKATKPTNVTSTNPLCNSLKKQPNANTANPPENMMPPFFLDWLMPFLLVIPSSQLKILSVSFSPRWPAHRAAAEKMDVEMRHALTGVGAFVNHKPITAGVDAFFSRHFRCHR